MVKGSSAQQSKQVNCRDRNNVHSLNLSLLAFKILGRGDFVLRARLNWSSPGNLIRKSHCMASSSPSVICCKSRCKTTDLPRDPHASMLVEGVLLSKQHFSALAMLTTSMCMARKLQAAIETNTEEEKRLDWFQGMFLSIQMAPLKLRGDYSGRPFEPACQASCSSGA